MIIRNQYNLSLNENGNDPQKIHCPKCHDERKNKRDKSLSISLKNRVFKCHHCGWADRIDGWKADENYVKPQKSGWSNFSEKVQLFFKGRGIGIETIKANKIIQKQFGGQLFLGFPYLMIGEHDPVNVKWRSVEEKEFRQEKDAMHIMYNLPMWANEKTAIICEGEMDVMSFNECGLWTATTLSDGAINEKDNSVEGKLSSLHNSINWILNKDRIYLSLDNDGPGRRLKDVLLSRFDAEKCYLIKLPSDCKDANECLLKYGKEKLLECYRNARQVPVSGLFQVSDIKDAMIDNFVKGVQMGELTHMGDFDRIFRWKKGQVNGWTGYANFGKTTFVLQVMMVKSILDGWKWCIWSPENYPAEDFYNDLIEMYVGKNVTDAFNNKMTLDEYFSALEFINQHFYFIYPEENHTVEELLSLVKTCIEKYGTDGFLFDPYNQRDKSEDEFGLTESQEVSTFNTKVKRFTVKHNQSGNIIIHPKLTDAVREGAKGGDFRPADIYELHGGAMWANKLDNAVSYHRPNWFKEGGKKDPLVHVYSQKVKRKRTGGELDKTEFFWDAKHSRFTDLSGKVFCDPKRIIDYQDKNKIEEDPF
jgi:twinkle protein